MKRYNNLILFLLASISIACTLFLLGIEIKDFNSLIVFILFCVIPLILFYINKFLMKLIMSIKNQFFIKKVKNRVVKLIKYKSKKFHKIKCLKCDSVLKINHQYLGKKGKCPKCKTILTISNKLPQTFIKYIDNSKIAKPIDLLPFQNLFICPKCGNCDTGKYCSNCSNSLQISKKQLLPLILNRMKCLNYSIISYSQINDNLSPLYSVSCNFDFSSLFNNESIVAVSVYSGQFGCILDFVILNEHNALSDSSIRSNIQNFWNANKDNINKQNLFTNIDERIQKISIRFAIFYNYFEFNEEYSENDIFTIIQNIGFKSIKTKRSKFRLNLFKYLQGFKVKMNWYTTLVDVGNNNLIQKSNDPFDALKNEIECSLMQLNTDTHSKTTNSKTCVSIDHDQSTSTSKVKSTLSTFYHALYKACIESIVMYFYTFYSFFKNRYFYADLIVNKKYLQIDKIIVLYFIGISISLMIAASFSFGQLSPSNLVTYSFLPPIISDIAELFQMIILYLFFALLFHYTMRMHGYKGSLKMCFISILFVNAFFQVFERPWNFIIDHKLFYFISSNNSYGSVYNILSELQFYLYFFLVYPFLSIIYKAQRNVILSSIGILGSFIGIVFYLFFGFTVVSNNYIQSQRNDYFLAKETTIVNEYIQLQEKKDSKDYKTYIQKLSPLIKKISLLEEEAHESIHNSEIKEKNYILPEYFNARKMTWATLYNFYLFSTITNDNTKTNLYIDDLKMSSDYFERVLTRYNYNEIQNYQDHFDVLINKDSYLVSDYKENVIPQINNDDQSRNYSKSIILLKFQINYYKFLVAETKILSKRVQESKHKIITSALSKYYSSRLNFLNCFVKYIQNNATEEQINKATSDYEIALENLNNLLQKSK